MTATLLNLSQAARRRLGWFVRDRFPDRKVVRDVQGVRLVLPWSHRLPDYAAAGQEYGQNLVRLAAALAEQGPLTVLDIGANVGDSALQILHAADGKVLCVEGDPAYLEFLHLNADADDRIEIVEALLTADEDASGMAAVRTGGTTRFTRAGGGEAADARPAVSPTALREGFPEFSDLRLVKSDTDGYDVALVPAVAAAWRGSRPVLFFEYDPYLVRLAGLDPLAVWPELEALGYRDVAVWDNGGSPLGHTSTAEVAGWISALDAFDRPGARTYWDVAVVHGDDTAARAAVHRLVPADQTLEGP